MDRNRWMVIALVGVGLLIFGYIVRAGHPQGAARLSQGPISVAAVRGGAEDPPPVSAPNANVAEGYVSALQDDVALAKKRTDAYNAAVKARSAEFSKAGQADGSAPQ